MKNDPKGKARPTMIGKTSEFSGKSKLSKEFQKYASMAAKPSARLPNAMVKGTRNANNTELVQQYKGNPEQGVRAGTPYYEVYQQQRRAAESPVNRENIPAEKRQQVKDYFDQIRP